MKIWLIDIDCDNYGSFYTANENQKFDILDEGNFVNENLIIEAELKNTLPVADASFFWGNLGIIINEKSKKILENYYSDSIQFIKVKLKDVNDCNYFLMHIIKNIDALDIENSNIVYLFDNYISDIQKYVFNSNIKNASIFQIYLNNIVITNEIYVNDDFKRLIEENNLTGFIFKEVFEFVD